MELLYRLSGFYTTSQTHSGSKLTISLAHEGEVQAQARAIEPAKLSHLLEHASLVKVNWHVRGESDPVLLDAHLGKGKVRRCGW
jgi:hypothetical protein